MRWPFGSAPQGRHRAGTRSPRRSRLAVAIHGVGPPRCRRPLRWGWSSRTGRVLSGRRRPARPAVRDACGARLMLSSPSPIRPIHRSVTVDVSPPRHDARRSDGSVRPWPHGGYARASRPGRSGAGLVGGAVHRDVAGTDGWSLVAGLLLCCPRSSWSTARTAAGPRSARRPAPGAGDSGVEPRSREPGGPVWTRRCELLYAGLLALVVLSLRAHAETPPRGRGVGGAWRHSTSSVRAGWLGGVAATHRR